MAGRRVEQTPVALHWLAGKFMRWLGTIAYPLYLWHWPMLILVTVYYNKTHPSIIMGVIVIAASLLLADLSHRFIDIKINIFW